MKEFDDVKARIAGELRAKLKTFNSNMALCIRNMEQAETIDDFMEYKRAVQCICTLLVPLYDSTCPYCLMDDDCNACDYTKVHGLCENTNSDWHRVYRTHNTLIKAICKM